MALATAVAAATSLALSCGAGRGPSKLVVTSASASPRDQGDRPTIRIQFADPVIDNDRVGAPLGAVPATIRPAIPLEGYWADRHTLALVPTANLAPSTRYRVDLQGELARRTGSYRFDFVHRPLVIEGIWGVDTAALPPRPKLPVHFNQAVRPLDVLESCNIRRDDGSEIALVLHDSKEAGKRVIVGPEEPLDKGGHYQLMCSRLSGAGGPEPLEEPFLATLSTYPELSIARFAPGGRDVPTDELKLLVQFATPVDLDQARRHVELVPPAAGIDRGTLDATGTRYIAVVNLDTERDYRLKVKPGLRDRYGQVLAEGREHRFRTGEATPRFDMETGIYALEPSQGGYPVWTRNLAHFDVECAAIPADQVVKLLTTSMNYDPWYNANSEIDWDGLGVRKRSARVRIDQPKDNWKLERLKLDQMCGGKRRGLFLAELHSDLVKLEDYSYKWHYRNQRRVLANVTDLGVLLKTGSTSGVVWVTRLSTGKPVEGAQVSLYDLKGKKVYTGRTDEKGLVKTPGANHMLDTLGAQDKDPFEVNPMSEWDMYRSRRLIAVVERGPEMAVVDGNWNNGIQVWNYGVREDRKGGKSRIRGFIQSDRGIYRPGETVHFKGLVRAMAAGQMPSVPAGRRIKVQVEDSRGRSLMGEILSVSPFGGFHFDLALSPHARLGDYHVTATIAGQSFREKFSVEEFRKLSFEVDVESEARHTELGQRLSFHAQADYLFGAPVADASVRWTVERRQRHVHFAKYPRYTFRDNARKGFMYWYYWNSDDRHGSFVSDGEDQTDDRGRTRFSVRDPYKQLDGTYDYIATAAVRDSSNQTVSKRAVVTAHPTDFYLGLHSQEFVQAVDMPFAINAVAVKPDGQRVPATAKLQMIRKDWRCVYSSGYRSHQTCKSSDVPIVERDFEIPASGTSVQRIVPRQPGEYVIRIDGKDSQGRPVSASTWVWVIGKGQAFWSGDESARLTLIANKTEYQPGEVARLVPRTGMKNPTALITIERDGVIDAEVRQLESASEGIEVPLSSGHAPNVYASVALVTGRSGKGDRNRPRFKMGVVDLPVSAEDSRLEVEVRTDRPVVEPGQKVTGTVVVKRDGKPVRAEVALSAADEGVLQLIGFETPDPMKTFYASFGLGIDSATNLNRIARLNDPLGLDLDEGGDGPGSGQRVRSKFVSSAYWNPEVYTDARGRARFSFEAPDDLTAFRIMAVAADRSSSFGSADTRLTVTKKVLAKPMLPRFLTAGDEALIGVVIHNHSGKPGQATVSVEGSGVRFARTRQVVTVGKSRRVVFPITALDRDQARFRFRVSMAAGNDAVEMKIPISRGIHFEQRVLASGVLSSATLSSIRIPVKPSSGALKSESSLSFTVDRTGMAELEPALEYLVQYPYGCLEQTLSRFVPLSKAKDLARSAGLDELEGAKMNTFLAAGAAKVVRHQHGDGHFSLWPGGRTYPHLTVYAVYGLLEARRAGVEIDDVALKRGLQAIKRWANRPSSLKPGGESATAAMAALVLAEADMSDPGLVARLHKARAGLPRYGQAFLLRAMIAGGSPRSDVDEVTQELLAGLKRKNGTLVVEEKMQRQSYYMGSDTRSTAMVLSALLKARPGDPIIDQLAEGLRAQRLESGRWRSTQDNLYALIALADYARSQKSGTTRITVEAGEKLEQTLVGNAMISKDIPLAKLGDSLRIQAAGRARYTVTLSEGRRSGLTHPVDNGFAIAREYLTPDGKPVTEIGAGDLVRVRLTIRSPKDRRWVALSDRLPAGFEVVNTKLASSASSVRTQRSWSWTHIELKDDRVLAFADWMSQRRPMVLEYLARATIGGEFAALPATVEAMYQPEVNGRTARKKVKIQ